MLSDSVVQLGYLSAGVIDCHLCLVRHLFPLFPLSLQLPTGLLGRLQFLSSHQELLFRCDHLLLCVGVLCLEAVECVRVGFLGVVDCLLMFGLGFDHLLSVLEEFVTEVLVVLFESLVFHQ